MFFGAEIRVSLRVGYAGRLWGLSMSPKSRGPVWVGVLVVAALAAVVVVVAYTVHTRRQRPPVAGPTTAPVVPASETAAPGPTTRPARKETPQFKTTYMDVVRADFASLPTTQPLAFPLELNQAARLVLKEPVFLSKGAGDLWITRPDAPPTPQVLKAAVDPATADAQTHVLRDRVVFVQWIATQAGNPMPYLVCAASGGGYEVVSSEGRKPLPAHRDYRWERAFVWDDKVVVPTATGIAVLQFRPELKESYRDLIASPSTAPTTTKPAPHPPQPQALPDGQGLLAWVPWEHGRPGSRGAVRYLDGKWIDLGPDQNWPEKIVQLVPLRDGTVFQFIVREDGTIGVETMLLEGGSVDEAAITKLVEKLSDPDPDERRKAVAQLADFGPGAWPTLTKLSAHQPPQARMLLKGLLKDKNRPTLSGMTLLGDRALQLACRLSDGGAVFYAPQGISLPDDNGDPIPTAPAWLSLRPGHFAELLPAALVMDLKPDDCHLDIVGDQWIATTDIRGPRLFFGNGFATLLKKDERGFTKILGIDSRGRWLFRKPSSSIDDRATSAPPAPPDPGRAGPSSGRDRAHSAPEPSETLIIDPHLPDVTPRLPVWNLAIAQTVGWDKDNWPVVQNGAAYALTDTDWRPLDKDEKFFHRPEDAPSPAAALPLGPTTASTSQPAAPSEPPILVTPDGTRYFGGLTDLTMIDRSGHRTTWPLPPAANGTGPVTLIATPDGKLFLFNQPGRVLRLARTPKSAEPFKLEATFTRNIPNTAHPTRIWLDPAGRIDIAYDTRLAILFPAGYLPRSISEKMVDPGDLDADFQ
jgi:hypothetical protein